MRSPSTPLEILVCNDDGIDAPGIHALVASLKKVGRVTVVAPHKQQSAVGHAITMNLPLRVRKFYQGKKFFGFAVEGTPADCVKLAVHSLLKTKPDLVVSGINHGSNTAVNLLYSGTVSAATEGTVLGIPSFAISLTTYEEPDFRFAAKFAAKLAKLVCRKGIPKGTLLNVNIPAVPERKIKGVMITRQGKSFWNDTFDARRDPVNRQYFWLTGSMEIIDTVEDADQIAIANNYISVSPIHYDLTDYAMMDVMKDWGVEKLHAKGKRRGKREAASRK